MKIIGNGFIAKSLKKAKLKSKSNYIIYAAGISNSKTNNKKDLEREKKAFKNFSKNLHSSSIIIYISSLSVLDKTLKNEKYVKNKLFIENFLKSKVERFIIVRLAQVVGFNKNPNTITNFFYNNIKNRKKFVLWADAKRSLIDIDDVKLIFKEIVKKNFKKKYILNIYNPNSISAKNIVDILSKILKFKPIYRSVYLRKTSKKLYGVKLKLNKFSKIFNNKNYNKNILLKYYK